MDTKIIPDKRKENKRNTFIPLL